MIDLSSGAWIMLGGTLMYLAGIALGILSEYMDHKHTDRPEMNGLHYRPREDYIRHIDGVDAEAVREAARRAKPVVPPESPFDEPHHYRKN